MAKEMSILVDEYNRICSICPDNLSGTTGWVWLDEAKLTEKTGVTVDEMFRSLTNGKGVERYKLVDEFVENRTPEEIAADEAKIPVELEEADEADYQAALEALGVNFDEENDA